MEIFVKCFRMFCTVLTMPRVLNMSCTRFWICLNMFLSDVKNILQTDCLLQFSYFTYSRGKQFLTLMTAWQLIILKRCQCSSKAYDFWNWNSFLICFTFKRFQRLTILFSLLITLSNSSFLGILFLRIFEMLLHFRIYISFPFH